MKLHRLKVEGLRRINNVEIHFGDATFLIGANNVGKSTVLFAIEKLLSIDKKVDEKDFYSIIDEETGETKPACTKIILEAEFRNLPLEALQWRGFKGRTFSYTPEGLGDSGISIHYRKIYELGKDVVVSLKTKKRILNQSYKECKTPQSFIDQGASSDLIQELFDDNLTKNITKSQMALLEEINDIWDLEDVDEWFVNPGGIPQVVISRLPRFLYIPADTACNEVDGGTSSVMGKMLSELFEDVRSQSTNFTQAQHYLDELAKELDPEDENSEFGRMLIELNGILANVFPDTRLHATTDLSKPDKVLKPTFNVEMSSNVRTSVNRQGSGMIRAAAFGILRYRQKWMARRANDTIRSMIIAFEEPELYLHPCAANQMRNIIYGLSQNDSQIIASTHSPFMIDLSRKPRQVLNRFSICDEQLDVKAFSVTDAFKILQGDDANYVKMLQRIDDHIARIFFTKYIVIVEGDTEAVVICETLKRLSQNQYNRLICDFEIIKARGKATIIALVKYLIALGVSPIVVHDRDAGTVRAEQFNNPIANAVGTNGRIIQMLECIEDEIGYEPPTSDKPYKAYCATLQWGSKWTDIPPRWQNKMKDIFGEYVP